MLLEHLAIRGMSRPIVVSARYAPRKRTVEIHAGTADENLRRDDSGGEKSRTGQQGPLVGAEFSPTVGRQRVVRGGTGRPRRRILRDDEPQVDGEARPRAPPEPPVQAPLAPPGVKQQDDLLTGLSDEEVERKSSILLAILTSGRQVEEQIRMHRREIDDVLLALLDRRMRAAARVGEERAVVEGMSMLLRRLKLEAARQAATPAQRVLDDALRIMHPSNPADFDDKRKAVEERLEQSFTARMDPWDIIGTASLLAKGEEVAEEVEDAMDFVAREQFIAETQGLLRGAQEQQQQIQAALRDRGGERQAGRLEAVARERALTIVHLQEILHVAQSMKS